MENKNTETSMSPAEQRAIMQNEILARGEDMPQDRVDTIMAQASEIAVKQVSSEAQDILVNATQDTEDTDVVRIEADEAARQQAIVHDINTRAAAEDWSQDRVDAALAQVKR